MPEIVPASVFSFSSEDKSFPAANLLKQGGFAKWKCFTAGEKQAVIELQFDQAIQIHQIDIGNEASAFIEVLVKRSSSTDDYQVLLVSSSFMSPVEARQSTNLNRVRMFTSDKLSKTTRDQKWDRVRIVCTQPFNKVIQYGLAFVKFYSPPKPDDNDVSSSTKAGVQRTISGFLVKGDDEDANPKPGSLFASKKKKKQQDSDDDTAQPQTATSQLRTASRVAETVLQNEESKQGTKPSRTRTASNPPLPSAPPSSSKTTPRSKAGPAENKPSTKRHAVSSESEEEERPSKPAPKRSAPKKPTETKKDTPFKKLLDGVVFALSGFQNPLRGELRDKATSMGAKYRPDWGSGCTHLICAFANTPKFQSVRGKGRIVTSKWIEDCHTRKSRLPWRSYRLGRAPSPPNASPDEEGTSTRRGVRSRYAEESDSDSDSDEDEPPKKTPGRRGRKNSEDEWTPGKKDVSEEEDSDAGKKRGTKRVVSPAKKKQKHDISDEEEEVTVPKNSPAKLTRAGTSTSASSSKTKSPTKATHTTQKDESSDDSADGWKPVRRKKASGSPVKGRQKAPAPEEEDTDEEIERKMGGTHEDDDSTDVEGDQDGDDLDTTPELPSFFTGKRFLFYGTFPQKERRLLARLIVAFDGVVEPYMSGEVNFVISKSTWDDNFDQALSDNANLIFVRPDWIFACDSAAKLVPYQKFLVTA